jgi:maltooligosyltrehalose trehalohydrolase
MDTTPSRGQPHSELDVRHHRCLPVGADVHPQGGVHFRVWASKRHRVEVVLEGGPGHRPGAAPVVVALEPEGTGYYSGLVAEAAAGTLYRYRLDGEPERYADPASRFQPDGPHGPSQVVDPHTFPWHDQHWRGVLLEGQVLYEMHLGTFTPEGTWEAAGRKLPALAALGVTVLEIMPIADFPGRFGWGYDGVNLFAPTRLYGTPDDCRRFIDRAHALGMGVILDVVYNHIGPEGNVLPHFSPEYFTDRYSTDWGEAINYEDAHAGPVREYFLANAGYWVEEFHFDGLRIDATQNIYDTSSDHILAAITRRVRRAAGGRATLLVGENEPQHTQLVRLPAQGGYGLDALWNDDFHHSATVAMTGRNEAYYTDYHGTPQELISALKYGWLYQGQYYTWQQKRRGTPALDLQPAVFVTFLQNHDQIANSGRGLRAHQLTSPGRYKALTAVMLLGPGTPMLFQGQEFAASSPFFYFTDFPKDLAQLTQQGRAKFLSQFPSVAQPDMQARLRDPADPETFARSKLDLSERQRHAGMYALHRDLLRLRREDPVFRAQRRGGLDGAVLGPEAFVLRFFGVQADDRLLVVNLGRDLPLQPAPEPLLAPPEGMVWKILWSSEDPHYDGGGTAPLEGEEGWQIPGHAAVVLRPMARAQHEEPSRPSR